MAIWYMKILEEKYVESKVPQSKQKHKGWYWDFETQKFYRWDNLPRD